MKRGDLIIESKGCADFPPCTGIIVTGPNICVVKDIQGESKVRSKWLVMFSDGDLTYVNQWQIEPLYEIR